MVSLCKYKNIFGVPNTGAHSIRVFNIAVIDFGLTLLFGFIISYTFKYNIYIVLAILFLSGIILHHIFCVRTTVDKLLFP
jgi:uncharacterized membrane protein (Fun14 family)